MSNRKTNKREFTKDITYLVNFNYEKPKQEAAYNGKRNNKQQNNVPFSKERFLQANYRFIVSPRGDYSNNIVDPDLLVEWDNVEQLCLQTFEEYNCPICLDHCIAAKVSRCGHVFCYPCIIRHLSYGSRFTGNCPVCFAFMTLKDLKSAVIQTVHHHNDNDTITFQLLKRAKYSTMALPRAQWRSSTETCPLDNDQNTRFCRFAITGDSSEIVERERAELTQALWEAQSSQDDSIPFIETALAEIEDRVVTFRKSEKLLIKESTALPKSQDMPVASAWDEPVKQDSISIISKSTTVKHEEEEHVTIEKSMEKLSVSAELAVTTEHEDFYYVYQSSDAQQAFLHPIDIRILLNQYKSYENFPETIQGKILEIEEIGQTEALRKRYRFLSHLPVACQFKFVEIDMRPLVSTEAIEPVYDDIAKRVRHRKNLKRKEEQEKARIEHEAMLRNAQIDMGEFPAYVNSYGEERPDVVEAPPEPVVVQSTSWPPAQEKPSFLAAAKSNKVHITSSMPVKQNSKGKQIVLMSTSAGRRKR